MAVWFATADSSRKTAAATTATTTTTTTAATTTAATTTATTTATATTTTSKSVVQHIIDSPRLRSFLALCPLVLLLSIPISSNLFGSTGRGISISSLYAYLRNTARPPPGPLPPQNLKADFTLQRFLAPIILLHIALCIPKRRWLVSAIFVPAILWIHWGTFWCGSRSSSVGFASGVYVVYHTYQTLDYLVFSNPRKDFFRVPVSVQVRHIDPKSPQHGKPIPQELLEPYPDTLSRRIPWVYELTCTMRFIGWHTPSSQPTTSRNLLSTCTQMSRSRFLGLTILRLFGVWLVLDFLKWNVRVNDTGFFFPYLVHSAGNSSDTRSIPQPIFTPDYPVVAIYPDPPQFISSFPWISLPKVYDISYPYPKYTLLPYPTPISSYMYTTYIFPLTLHITRTIAQTLSIYCGIIGNYSMTCLIVFTISYFVYPPYTPSLDEKLEKSRWFNPASYPHPYNFFTLSSLSSPMTIQRFWSVAWHNLFRRVFLRPSIALQSNKIISLLCAFFLSGVLHLCGTRTQACQPVGGWGSFVFFTIQPIGILIEVIVREAYLYVKTHSNWMSGKGGNREVTTKILNLVEALVAWAWTFSWFMYTSTGFFDEFCWGAIWRIESTPVSLWQEGWFRWTNFMSVDGVVWRWWEWSQNGKGWGMVL